jgi:hypothetical protein
MGQELATFAEKPMRRSTLVDGSIRLLAVETGLQQTCACGFVIESADARLMSSALYPRHLLLP